MASSKHVFLCAAKCDVVHCDMLLALCNCPDSNKPEDLEPLRQAIDVNLRTSWELHSDIPDLHTEYQFPLVHWACVLGKPRILEWLLSEQSFKAGVVKEKTGETGLHRIVVCFFNNKKKTKDRIARRVSIFDKVVTVLTNQDPEVLFKSEIMGNTALHYCANYAICLHISNKERAFFHHCFTFLLQRVADLVNKKKLAINSLTNVLSIKNSDGNTVLHILARSNASSKVVNQVLLDYKDFISASVKNNEGQSPVDVAVQFKADLVLTHLKVFWRSRESNNTERSTEGNEAGVSDGLGSVQVSNDRVLPLSLPNGRAVNLRASVQINRTAVSAVHLGGQGQAARQPIRVVPVRFVMVQHAPCPVSRPIPAVTNDETQPLPAHDLDASRQLTCQGDLERSFHEEGPLEDNKPNVCPLHATGQGIDNPSMDIATDEPGVQPASFPDLSVPRALEENGEMTSHNAGLGHVPQREETGLVTPTSSDPPLEHSQDVASLLRKKLEQIQTVAEEVRGELGDTESRERVAGCELQLLESALQEVQTEREAHEKTKRELLEEINRKEKDIMEREDSIKKQIEDKERVVEDLKCQAGALTEEVGRLKRKCNSYMDVLDDCSVAEDSPPRKRDR